MRVAVIAVALFLFAGCTRAPGPPQLIKSFPLDGEPVLAATGVSFDKAQSADGRGSLRIDATGDRLVVPLFEVKDLNVDNAVLLYAAKVQSQNLDGRAYLEMWVRVQGKGEFFSRGLQRPVTGTMSWMDVGTPFFLEAGQRADLARLNVVVEGKGRVWVDDVRLEKQSRQ